MSGPDTAPTEPFGSIPLGKIQRLLNLPPDKTITLSRPDRELHGHLVAIAEDLKRQHPDLSGDQIKAELQRRFTPQ